MGSYAQDTQNLLAALKATPLGAPVHTEISSTFGSRANPFSGAGAEAHSGLDFRGQIGDSVAATASGVVNLCRCTKWLWQHRAHQPEKRLRNSFAHLSEIDVKNGQTVNSGDIIGKVGSTGRSTYSHLHYEVRKNGTPIDPEQFLTLATQ